MSFLIQEGRPNMVDQPVSILAGKFEIRREGQKPVLKIRSIWHMELVYQGKQRILYYFIDLTKGQLISRTNFLVLN
jgi:hypothetical protein